MITLEELFKDVNMEPEVKSQMSKALISFAKLHVQCALVAASDNTGFSEAQKMDILTAYPLENIK